MNGLELEFKIGNLRKKYDEVSEMLKVADVKLEQANKTISIQKETISNLEKLVSSQRELLKSGGMI